MTTLTIELPPGIELSEYELKKMFVAKLYEEGIVPPGRGAEMLGMTYREFIETFGMYCRMTPEDLDKEMETLRRWDAENEARRNRQKKTTA